MTVVVIVLLAATGRKLFWPSESWQSHQPDHGPAARLGSLSPGDHRRLGDAGGPILAERDELAVVKPQVHARSAPSTRPGISIGWR